MAHRPQANSRLMRGLRKAQESARAAVEAAPSVEEEPPKKKAKAKAKAVDAEG